MVLEIVLTLGPQVAPVPELAPGTRYDEKIATLKQVGGHDLGQEITTPEQVVLYSKALRDAAPSRAALVEYARSWEGRPLHVMAVASP